MRCPTCVLSIVEAILIVFGYIPPPQNSVQEDHAQDNYQGRLDDCIVHCISVSRPPTRIYEGRRTEGHGVRAHPVEAREIARDEVVDTPDEVLPRARVRVLLHATARARVVRLGLSLDSNAERMVEYELGDHRFNMKGNLRLRDECEG